MSSWVIYHSLTSLEDFLMWELDTLKYCAISACCPSRNSNQPDSFVLLKPYSIRHIIILRKYIHHLFQDSHLSVASDASDHVLEPADFLHTSTFRHCLRPQSYPLPSLLRQSTPQPQEKHQKGYLCLPTIKDEKYYESFKRSMLVTARAHDCEEILQPTFRPRSDADSLELFRLKIDFMYSVFNKYSLSVMGKTIVRKHLDNMNDQGVWRN